MNSIKILPIPFPFKAMLSISNDPDNTTIEAWHELNEFIFNELKLDWANTVFPINKNLNLPNQVSLESHPQIASQPTDTLHTWGDFVHSGNHGFTRDDAETAIRLLENNRISPKIWVDHSRFLGNLLHGKTTLGGKQFHTDASGVKYKNFEYTADLIHSIGIRYLWDGDITQIIGQDRKLSLLNFSIKQLIKRKYTKENEILTPIEFEGFRFYKFKRYGEWKYADILGFSKVINIDYLDTLVKKGGISFIYTHLGKRNPKQTNENHIPVETKNALINISNLVKEKQILFAPISRILDYVILRDNIKIEKETVNFKPDGIRYTNLSESDLLGHSFSFKTNAKKISFKVNNNEIQPKELNQIGSVLTVCF